MARRGFFATIQHQARIAAREREQRDRQAARDHAASNRRAEQAGKAAARAQTQLAKTADSERKRLEKEAKEAHLEAMEAEVDERNRKLGELDEEIDSILTSSLSRDSFVDLNTLRVVASHPAFDRTDLEAPIPRSFPIPDPAEPVLIRPEAPRGLAGLFGKRRHAEAVADADRAQEHAIAQWRAQCQDTKARRQAVADKHARDEAQRLQQLETERIRFAEQCKGREDEAAESNRKLEQFIVDLGYGIPDAVQEYVSIVLANSVYPDHFPVTHEIDFDPSSAEIKLKVLVPGPGEIPEIKAYKYTRASDEITSAALSQKECREHYASAVHQVALRSFHEIFESDRRGLIRTVSIEVGTNTVDPATGQHTYVPFIIAAAERDTFLKFDLSAVVPALTLGRLGAAVSKGPSDLVAADRLGVRRA